MNYEIGSIVCLDKIIFKTRFNSFDSCIDHASKRPCVIIAEDEENTYFLHFTSSKIRKEGYDDYQYYYGEKNENNIGGYISMQSVHKRRISYREEIDKVPEQQLVKILEQFCYFQEQVKQDSEYEKIKDIIYQKIGELKDNQIEEKEKKLCLKIV